MLINLRTSWANSFPMTLERSICSNGKVGKFVKSAGSHCCVFLYFRKGDILSQNGLRLIYLTYVQSNELLTTIWWFMEEIIYDACNFQRTLIHGYAWKDWMWQWNPLDNGAPTYFCIDRVVGVNIHGITSVGPISADYLDTGDILGWYIEYPPWVGILQVHHGSHRRLNISQCKGNICII